MEQEIQGSISYVRINEQDYELKDELVRYVLSGLNESEDSESGN